MNKPNRPFHGLNLLLMVAMVAGLVALPAPSALALTREKTVDRVTTATEVVKAIINIPEGGIPDYLLRDCVGLVVIPNVVEGAFLFGGRHGRGILIHRLPNGYWSNPCFVALSGGSFGLQVGGQSVDLVLVIKNRKGYEAILDDNFTFSGDAVATAGPVGRNAEAGTDLAMRAKILSYSRSRGVFAGISIQGATLTIDRKANYTFYKKLIDQRKILNDTTLPYLDEYKPMIELLHPYTLQAQAQVTEAR
jgi:lipid-binding SYLF domain-containing protein